MENLNKHIIKAIDNYPYNLEECIEGIQFALSSSDNPAMALCLMGRIYAEQFRQYDRAKSYFQDALVEDFQLMEIYPHYINALIENEDYEDAERLMDYSFTLKGLKKDNLWELKIYMLERMAQYDKALECIKSALCEGYDERYLSSIEEAEKRIIKKKKWIANVDTKPKSKKKGK